MSRDPHAELRREVKEAKTRRDICKGIYDRAALEWDTAAHDYDEAFLRLMDAEQSTCYKMIVHRRQGENVYCKRPRGHEGECFD